jgi:hypothetical protein
MEEVTAKLFIFKYFTNYYNLLKALCRARWCTSVVKDVVSMHKALGLMPRNEKEKLFLEDRMYPIQRVLHKILVFTMDIFKHV